MTDTLITVDVSSAALISRAREGQAVARENLLRIERERQERARQEKARRERLDREQADRLGRSRLRQRGKREEVAAGYVPASVLCVAVLDETDRDEAYFTEKWASFREKYGRKRPVVVLCVSYPGLGFDLQSSFVQTYPDPFSSGIPFPMPYQELKRYRATRNNQLSGQVEPVEAPTIWQDVLSAELAGKRTILLSVDDSGSMSTEEVQESYDSFVAWATGRGIKLYAADMENLEDYITPFDQPIRDLERIQP